MQISKERHGQDGLGSISNSILSRRIWRSSWKRASSTKISKDSMKNKGASLVLTRLPCKWKSINNNRVQDVNKSRGGISITKTLLPNWKVGKQDFEGLLWGLKNGSPAHFTSRAQSPGRGALLSGTHNKSSLKAQGCGLERLYARHLAKRPKKRTDSAQEQHRGKGCQHLNVEPIAWQTHTRTMLSSSSPITLTWGLIRQVTTPNKEKLTRMWRTGENTSIKGGGRCPQEGDPGRHSYPRGRMKHYSDQVRGDRPFKPHPCKVWPYRPNSPSHWLPWKSGSDPCPAPNGRPFQTHSLQIILFGPFKHEPNVILGS